MSRKIIIQLVLGLLIGGISAQTASAGVLERSCECQGFGRAGDNIPAGTGDTTPNNLTRARSEAVEDCRAGTQYRGPGNNCSLPACPAGSIDITPVDATGRSLLVDCSADGGDIDRTYDRSLSGSTVVERHNPAAAGCQWSAGAFQCSLTCTVKRQCAL